MSELLRVCRPFANRDEALEKSQQMHQRHGCAVASVLRGLSEDVISKAPVGSIAAIFGHLSSTAEPVAAKTEPAIPGPAEHSSYPQAKVLEIMRNPSGDISLIGIEDFFGVHARLISCLLDKLEEDRLAGRRLQDYRCLKGRELGDLLGVSEDYVRTEIKRIRQRLREAWKAIHDTAAPKDFLILTEGKRGYRLDSATNIVSPGHAS